MKKKVPGMLTVFFCLILTGILAFVCMIGESVRVLGSRIQAQAAVDSGMDSLFSEYHRMLMESYDLFFISGGYDTGIFAGETLTERLREYMTYNLQPERGHILLKNTDFWRVDVTDCRLTSYTAATDHACREYRRQAADTMKTAVAGQLLEKLKSWEEDPLDLDEIQKAYEEREAASEKEIEQLEKEGGGAEDADAGNMGGAGTLQTPDGEEAFNPVTFIKELKKRGILSAVLPSGISLSEKALPSSGLVSGRELSVGNAEPEDREDFLRETEEKVLFHEYLMSKFSCYTGEKKLSLPEGKALSYELEYVIAGKRSDLENLKSVTHRLLILREAVNFAYLMTDPAKQTQAETAALAVTGLAGVAPLSKAVKYGILLAWAYAESILDVRNLLAGGTVVPVKSAATWQMELADMEKLVSDFPKEGSVQEGGLAYEDYLRLLLYGEKETILTLRSLDLIEQNMQKQAGNRGFLADALICRAEVKITFRLRPLFLSFPFSRQKAYGGIFTVETAGAYMTED